LESVYFCLEGNLIIDELNLYDDGGKALSSGDWRSESFRVCPPSFPSPSAR